MAIVFFSILWRHVCVSVFFSVWHVRCHRLFHLFHIHMLLIQSEFQTLTPELAIVERLPNDFFIRSLSSFTEVCSVLISKLVCYVHYNNFPNPLWLYWLRDSIAVEKCQLACPPGCYDSINANKVAVTTSGSSVTGMTINCNLIL